MKSPLDGGAPISADGHSALVEFEITGDDLEARDRLGPAAGRGRGGRRPSTPTCSVEQFGDVSTNKELNETFTEDLLKAEQLSLPITLLILVIAFGALVAALVPLLLGITAVMAAMSLVAIPSHLSPVDSNISSVILLVGLAVGVDYSLFYMRREREERAAGRDERSALEVAAATSGRAVLISGLTVIAAMAGMFLSGDKTFYSFAEGTILVVAIAMFASLTVLPAVLAWLGDRIEKGRIPFLGRRRRAGESRFWSAIVDRVMRRPWLAILIAGGALVALAMPALNMKIVVSGPDDLPQDLEVIQTYNRRAGCLPDGGRDRRRRRRGERTSAALQPQAGISQLRRRAEDSDVALGETEVDLQRRRHGGPDRDPHQGQRERRRSRPRRWTGSATSSYPTTIGGISGVTVNVSGNAAQSKDFRDLLVDRLPLIFAFVFALAFLLHAVHLPLDRDPDQGDHPQPALGRGGLRGPGAGLPGGPWRVAARLHLERRDHLMAAAVPVRAPVRALDGLPRLHPLPGTRGLRQRDEHRRRRSGTGSRPPRAP